MHRNLFKLPSTDKHWVVFIIFQSYEQCIIDILININLYIVWVFLESAIDSIFFTDPQKGKDLTFKNDK